MRIAIHQPNFLPWIGYFSKILGSDKFVLLDTVPFSKGSYTNRVKIKTANGPKWLTVPIKTSGKLGQPINEVCCVDDDWRVKILGQLEVNYKGSPYYGNYIKGIRDGLYASNVLSVVNIGLIEYIAGKLLIKTPMVVASKLGVDGKSTELLTHICGKLSASEYLSGSGGAKYQEESAFADAGVKLIYIKYNNIDYEQQFGQFASGLSVVDLLFNCGPESGEVVRANAHCGGC